MGVGGAWVVARAGAVEGSALTGIDDGEHKGVVRGAVGGGGGGGFGARPCSGE